MNNSMEKQKKEAKKENVLETGSYIFKGPDNGDIQMDLLELNAGSGAKRIWKIKSLTDKEVIFQIVKFG